MSPIQALLRGIRAALARPRLLAGLTVVDLAIAAIAVAPAYGVLDASLSLRADTPALARRFDLLAYLEVFQGSSLVREGWPWTLAASLAFGWAWGAVSAAGWLSAAKNEGFLAGVGRLGTRFLRLAVVVAVGLCALEALRALLSALFDRWSTGITSEWLARGATLSVAALHGLVVLLLLGASDVAKARMHREDRRSALRALVAGLRFLLRNPMATGAVVLAGVALQAILLLAAGLTTDLTLGASMAGLWVPLLAGQVFVALRIAVRAGTLLAFAEMSDVDWRLRSEAPSEPVVGTESPQG